MLLCSYPDQSVGLCVLKSGVAVISAGSLLFERGGWCAKALAEDAAEVGGAFKAAFKGCIRYRPVHVAEEVQGMVKPLFQQPLARRLVELFGKIPFESGEAAGAEAGKFFELQVVAEVVFHDTL